MSRVVLSLVSVVAILVGGAAGCTSDKDGVASRCVDMKRELEACVGTPARDLDCAAMSAEDVARIEGAMDVVSCSAIAQGVTLDGDPKSATCRLYGAGCVASRTEAPSLTPTRYPVVLVNGIDDSPLFRYSDRIVRVVRDEGGHDVHLATLPSWSPTRVRASALWKRIEEVRKATGAAKVNLVCHSLGGLDCRYVASPNGLRWDIDVSPETTASAIASVTTTATAHHGTRVADVILGLAPDGDRTKTIDAFIAFTGGLFSSQQVEVEPKLRDALTALTTSDAARFEAEITDAPGVYYQSFAGYSRPFGTGDADHDARVLEACAPDEGAPLARVDHDYMALPLVPFADVAGKIDDGTLIPNDGLVTVASARWGTFRGCIPADHMEQLGQRNLPDANVRTGFDVARFYANVASDLAERGF
jgi:triacylglycerol lipase